MKNKSLLIIAFLLLAIVSCTSIDASTGDKIDKAIEVPEFRGIQLQNGCHVNFTTAKEQSIIINTTQAVLDVMEITVDNSILSIRTKNGERISNSDAINITITAPFVHTFINSGSGALTINSDDTTSLQVLNFAVSGSGEITTNAANSIVQTMTVSGSGDIIVDKMITESCQATISGSGSIKCMGGTANNSVIAISGSGSYSALETVSNRATAKISGSGTVNLYVKEKLNIAISGSGDVNYKGDPEINQSISGSGEVIDGN